MPCKIKLFIYKIFRNFVQAMNGTTCAVMVFYQDTVNGQNSTATPRWIGINEIGNTLDSTLTAIDAIIANGANAFPSSDDDNGSLVDFTNTLDSSYTTFSSSQLNNPNPQPLQAGGITVITPLYINNYGDYQTSGTTLNSIYREFDTKLQASYDIRTTTKGYVTDFTNNANSVKQQVTLIKQAINDFQIPFDSFSDSVVGTWIDVVKYYY
jgi:hypothetical protein